jgi:hypothetical protein
MPATSESIKQDIEKLTDKQLQQKVICHYLS